jgi:hypothetical protein
MKADEIDELEEVKEDNRSQIIVQDIPTIV